MIKMAENLPSELLRKILLLTDFPDISAIMTSNSHLHDIINNMTNNDDFWLTVTKISIV